MAAPLRFGVVQLTMEPVAEMVRTAQACEEAGFDTFWLGEAYPWWRKHAYEARSSTSLSALIAEKTQRITIGWGIISPYTRHPVQIGMEARVLQEVAGPDRFLLGLGASRIFMRAVDAQAGPLTVMREAVEIVRGFLSGDELHFDGKAFSAELPPLAPDVEAPADGVPLYMAGTGQQMQRLAGEIADGLLTASITTPEFLRWTRANLEEGASRAGRDLDDFDLGAVIVSSIGDDPEEGSQGAREITAMYLANKVQNIRGAADVLLEKAGLTFDEILPIADALDTGGLPAAAAALTDEVFAKAKPIAGTPKQCISAIEEYIDAGCRHFVLELWGPDRAGQARKFAPVLEHFRANG